MSEENKIFHVLVIDDETNIRDMIEEALGLNPLNLKVYKAKDGVEGLTKIRNQTFDLVITDLNMPKMSGKDLLNEVKVVDKDLRPKNFIVASGYVEKEFLKDTPGGVSIIRKPFSVDDLNKYVQVILSAKKKKKSPSKKAASKLNVDFINPFIDATLEVLEVMCETPAEKDFLFLKEDNQNLGDITGFIPINSEKHIGSMAITFPKDVYVKIMTKMLLEEYTDINEDNQDGVGELCNQIFGNAKATLNKNDIFLDMTIPTVIVGPNHTVNHSINGAGVLGVYFKTEFGTFVVECTVVEKA